MINRAEIYKWMYQKNKFWTNVYQLFTMYVRQPFYIFTGRANKAARMITEHFEWDSKS